jgi:hypothetical protein
MIVATSSGIVGWSEKRCNSARNRYHKSGTYNSFINITRVQSIIYAVWTSEWHRQV